MNKIIETLLLRGSREDFCLARYLKSGNFQAANDYLELKMDYAEKLNHDHPEIVQAVKGKVTN